MSPSMDENFLMLGPMTHQIGITLRIRSVSHFRLRYPQDGGHPLSLDGAPCCESPRFTVSRELLEDRGCLPLPAGGGLPPGWVPSPIHGLCPPRLCWLEAPNSYGCRRVLDELPGSFPFLFPAPLSTSSSEATAH